MNRYATLAMLLLSQASLAAGYQIDLDFSKPLSRSKFTRLEIDATPTGRFYSVNGAIYDEVGAAIPVAGTCMIGKAGDEARCQITAVLYDVDVRISTKAGFASISVTQYSGVFDYGVDAISGRSVSIKPK